MSAWPILEQLLVVLAIGACAAYAARTMFPGTWKRARIALALSLLRRTELPWLCRLGRALAPAPVHAGIPKASTCGPCRGCDK